MKRLLLIGSVGCASLLLADTFVDDVYYLPDLEVTKVVEQSVTMPYYNRKKIKEIVFVVDDSLSLPVDTLSVQAY